MTFYYKIENDILYYSNTNEDGNFLSADIDVNNPDSFFYNIAPTVIEIKPYQQGVNYFVMNSFYCLCRAVFHCTKIDLSGFSASGETISISKMFEYDLVLEEVILPKITGKVAMTNGVCFHYYPEQKHPNMKISGDLTECTGINGLFSFSVDYNTAVAKYEPIIDELDITGIQWGAEVTNVNSLFYGCSCATIKGAELIPVVITTEALAVMENSTIKSIDLSGWQLNGTQENPVNISTFFKWCRQLRNVVLPTINGPVVHAFGYQTAPWIAAGYNVPDKTITISGTINTPYIYHILAANTWYTEGWSLETYYEYLHIEDLRFTQSVIDMNHFLANWRYLKKIYASENIYKSGITNNEEESPFLWDTNLENWTNAKAEHAVIGDYLTYAPPAEGGLEIIINPENAAEIRYRLERDEYQFEININNNENGKPYIFSKMEYITPSGISNEVYSISQAKIPVTEEGKYTAIFTFIDPDTQNQYNGGGTSEDADRGGNSKFPNPDDKVTPDNVPNISTLQGFATVYNPTYDEIEDFGHRYFKSVVPSIETLSYYLIDLFMIPAVLPVTDQKYPIKLGKTFFWAGGEEKLSSKVVTKQFVKLSCGELKIEPYWNGFMDYNPHTKLILYLPYIGYHAINTDWYMGKTLAINYIINVYNGDCVAQLTADGVLMETFNGNCKIDISYSGQGSIMNSIKGMLQMTAGAVKVVGSLVSGGAIGGMSGLGDIAGGIDTYNKEATHSTGQMGSVMGLMSNQKPYLIIEKPRQSVPRNYSEENGLPVNVSGKLGGFKGYTVVNRIDVNNCTCTDEEKQELEQLLSAGVIL